MPAVDCIHEAKQSANKPHFNNLDIIEIMPMAGVKEHMKDKHNQNVVVKKPVETSGDVWQNGPDCLVPSESYTMASLNGAVKIRPDTSDHRYEPISIYTAFKKTVEKNPNHTALGEFP
jgi:hypothetical protein